MAETLNSFALLAHVEKLVEDRIEKHELENKHVLEDIAFKLSNLEQLIKDGFPHGDVAGHRRVHERYIMEAEERRQMIVGAKQKVFEGTLWAALVILTIALWDYFKLQVKL